MAPAQGQFTDPPPPQPAYAAVTQQPAYAAVPQQPAPPAPAPAPAPERARDGGRESRRRRSPSPRRDRDRDRDSRCVVRVSHHDRGSRGDCRESADCQLKQAILERGSDLYRYLPVRRKCSFNWGRNIDLLGKTAVFLELYTTAARRWLYGRASGKACYCCSGCLLSLLCSLFGEPLLLGIGCVLGNWYRSRPELVGLGCPNALL